MKERKGKERKEKKRKEKTRQDKTRQDKTRQEKKRQEKTRKEKKNQLKSKKFQRYELVKDWKRIGNKELLLSSFCILRPIISISKKKEGKTTKLLLDCFFRLIVDLMKFN